MHFHFPLLRDWFRFFAKIKNRKWDPAPQKQTSSVMGLSTLKLLGKIRVTIAFYTHRVCYSNTHNLHNRKMKVNKMNGKHDMTFFSILSVTNYIWYRSLIHTYTRIKGKKKHQLKYQWCRRLASCKHSTKKPTDNRWRGPTWL